VALADVFDRLVEAIDVTRIHFIEAKYDTYAKKYANAGEDYTCWWESLKKNGLHDAFFSV